MNISDKFVQLIQEKAEGKLLENFYDDAKLCVIDYLGCALAGAKMIDSKVNEAIDVLGGNGNVPVIGKNIKTSPLEAALINGMHAHVAELDDGHRYAMLHPGTPVISALISAAATGKIKDGENFLKGVIVGYEVTCRLAQSIQPGHKLKGFHATGTCGNIGAAFAVAVASEYPKYMYPAVLSAAVASASGLLEMIDSPSQLKPFTVGQAAMNGYSAACIGRSAFIGPNDPLGGKRAFFQAFADGVDVEGLLLGNEYKIRERYTKGYAACRHCHPAIEAALVLTEQYSVDYRKIDKINVYTYKLAIFGHDQKTVKSVSAAKMSTPFSVATALINRKADFSGFSEEVISGQNVINLATKVDVLEDEELTKLSPGKRAARVEIFMNDGEHFAHQVDYPLGEPENPMDEKMITEKYFSLANFGEIERDKSSKILEKTKQIENNLDTWIKLL